MLRSELWGGVHVLGGENRNHSRPPGCSTLQKAGRHHPTVTSCLAQPYYQGDSCASFSTLATLLQAHLETDMKIQNSEPVLILGQLTTSASRVSLRSSSAFLPSEGTATHPSAQNPKHFLSLSAVCDASVCQILLIAPRTGSRRLRLSANLGVPSMVSVSLRATYPCSQCCSMPF